MINGLKDIELNMPTRENIPNNPYKMSRNLLQLTVCSTDKFCHPQPQFNNKNSSKWNQLTVGSEETSSYCHIRKSRHFLIMKCHQWGCPELISTTSDDS